MTGGRKPKPTALKLVDGTRKDRINKAEPKAELGLPRVPAHLDDAAKKKWKQLVADVHWFARVDGDAVAAYCVAWGRWIDAEESLRKTGTVLKSTEGGFYQNPYLHVANKAMEQLQKWGAVLGLNPSDRGRLQVGGYELAEDIDPLEAHCRKAERKA